MTPAPRVPETVLLVEDDSDIRTFVQRILEEGGLTVLVAGDAATALQIESQSSRPIHLLLSDVMMPGMSGPELAKRLKQLRPEMRVMLMSGNREGMIILNYGWYFLHKPFLSKTLMAKVNDVLHSELRDQGTDHFDTRL